MVNMKEFNRRCNDKLFYLRIIPQLCPKRYVDDLLSNFLFVFFEPTKKMDITTLAKSNGVEICIAK
jgi:hypothetical protein